MRSWLLPGTIAGLIEASRLFGEGPGYYLPLIAATFALLASAPILCCFLWCRGWFGLPAALVGAAAVAIAPELVYFGARTLNEVVAAHILVIGCYLHVPAYSVNSRRRLFTAGMLFGLACLLRIQIAPAIAILALWSMWGRWRIQFPPIIAGAVVVLVLGAILDWATLGYPLASVWRNVLYNLLYGINTEFGVEPRHYYLLGELGVWGASSLFLVLVVAFGAWRRPSLLVASITIVAVHSSIAHKEYRFIYPAVLLITVLAGFGLAQLTEWGTQWLVARGKQGHAAATISAAIVLCCWGIADFGIWTGSTMTMLRRLDHDNIIAERFVADLPGLCGLGLYGKEGHDWVWYGGYTYLHRRLPMYWPEDETELAQTAPAFDTLLYTAAPPPELGFTTQQCFGEVCVARRPGTCEAQPMSAMPFPAPIAGLAPPKEKYEAVPAAAVAASAR